LFGVCGAARDRGGAELESGFEAVGEVVEAVAEAACGIHVEQQQRAGGGVCVFVGGVVDSRRGGCVERDG